MKFKELIRCVALLFLFQSCSHQAVNKAIDEKLSQESDMKSRTELRNEIRHVIQTAPGLTDEQKTQLTELGKSIRTQTEDMREQSFKLRSLLIKELVSTDYNSAEVDAIKKRIKSLEDKRLEVLFGAVEKANSILGHQAVLNRHLMDQFWWRE